MALAFSAYAIIANFLPFIELPVFTLPKVPLSWALAVVMAAVLFMVVEGSYRLHHQKDVALLSNSKVLSVLPVYPDIFRQEILAICEGIRANSQLYVFLNMRLVSTVDTSIFNSFLRVKDDSGKRYKATKVTSLADWELEEGFFDQGFKMDNVRRIPIETIALQTDIFRAGVTNNGWICFEMDGKGDGKLIRLENIVAMTMEIEDGLRSIHKLHFPEKVSWPIKGKIIHSSLRRLA